MTVVEVMLSAKHKLSRYCFVFCTVLETSEVVSKVRYTVADRASMFQTFGINISYGCTVPLSLVEKRN
ncbi:hypothetical protein IG631_19630 [Alternaria alternata]|nr:hypothetical protein IG631_19630 [Alternaria alternata]